jgi:hypothetical protein
MKLITIDDKENMNNNIRNRRFLNGELKLRINRLTEEYE